jgi:hypothetical protein
MMGVSDVEAVDLGPVDLGAASGTRCRLVFDACCGRVLRFEIGVHALVANDMAAEGDHQRLLVRLDL